MDNFDIRKWRSQMLIEAAERAEKDYDGDGKVESPEEEYLGSKDRAIKASMKNEAPEGMYYIEVSVRDARRALELLDDMYRKQFETSGSNVYYFGDGQTAYDAMMDFRARDIEIEDTNIEEAVNEELNLSNYGKVTPPKGGASLIGKYNSIQGKSKYDTVIFDYQEGSDKPYGIVQVEGHGIYGSDLLKRLGLRQTKSWTTGVDVYIHDGNNTPVYVSEDDFKALLDFWSGGLDREAKAQADFYRGRGNTSGTIDENLNPEVSKAVNRFIKAMAKRYDYSEQDAVYAVMSALRKENFQGLNEMDLNDPVMMKMRAAKDKLSKMRAANAGNDGNDKFFAKNAERLRKLKALKDKRAQIMRDMEQEAEPEGGPIADKYGDMLNKIDKAISMLQPPGEKGNEYMSKDEIERRAAMISVNEVTRYSGFTRNSEDPDSEPFNPTGSVAEFREDLRALFGKFKGDLKNPEFIKGVAEIMVNWKSLLRSQLEETNLNEAEHDEETLRREQGLEEINDTYFIIQSLKTGSPKYIANIEGRTPLWVPDSRIRQAYKFATLDDAKNYISKFDPKKTASWYIYKRPYDSGPKDLGLGKNYKNLDKLVYDTFGKRKDELEEDIISAINAFQKDQEKLYKESVNEAEEDDPQEIKVGNYQTKYFDMCPGATAVYKDIENKVEDIDLAERAVKLQDALFYIEKHILEDQEQGTDEGYITVAENLADQIMAIAKMMDLEQEHSYIQSHVDTIKKALKGEDTESTADQLSEGTCSCGCGGCNDVLTLANIIKTI